MERSTEKQPTEDRHDSETEEMYRSLGTDLGTEALKIGAGATVALVVKDLYDKGKDVLAPKDDAPKIELPPGVKK